MMTFEEWAISEFGAGMVIPGQLRRAWDAATVAEREACAKLCALEAAGCDLLEWDRKYPKGTIYNNGQHTDCEDELTAIVERFRELLAHNEPRSPDAQRSGAA